MLETLKTPKRRIALWSTVVASVALLGAGSWPILSVHTEPPKTASESARKAVENARGAQASVWAPDALREAESALRAAQMENRIQEVRFLPFRDFRSARTGFAIAEEKAGAQGDLC